MFKYAFPNLLRSLYCPFQKDKLTSLKGLHRNRLLYEQDSFKQIEKLQKDMGKKGAERILIGRMLSPLSGEKFSLQLPYPELCSHAWFTGSSGSGKSFLVLCYYVQLFKIFINRLLQRKPVGSIILDDKKGEMVDILSQVILPALLWDLPEQAREAILNRIVSIDLFHKEFLPEFNILLCPYEISVESHAQAIINVFEQTISGKNQLGIKQRPVFFYFLCLCIEQKLSFLELKRALQDSFFLSFLLSRSQRKEVKDFFTFRYPKESDEIALSLLSRLDNLLSVPELRYALAGRQTIDFQKLLHEPYIVLINHGSVPPGSGKHKLFASKMISLATHQAVYQRKASKNTPPIFYIADEWQIDLANDPDAGERIEHLLTLARFKSVFFWLINQNLEGQISGSLLKILRNNTNYQFIFRNLPEDARKHLIYAMPVTGKREKPKVHPFDPQESMRFLTKQEEAVHLANELAELPDRWFYFLHKRKYKAQLLFSPTLNLNKLEAVAKKVPREIKERIERGILGRDIRELKKIAHEREHASYSLQGKEAFGIPPSLPEEKQRVHQVSKPHQEKNEAKRQEIQDDLSALLTARKRKKDKVTFTSKKIHKEEP